MLKCYSGCYLGVPDGCSARHLSRIAKLLGYIEKTMLRAVAEVVSWP